MRLPCAAACLCCGSAELLKLGGFASLRAEGSNCTGLALPGELASLKKRTHDEDPGRPQTKLATQVSPCRNRQKGSNCRAHVRPAWLYVHKDMLKPV